MEVGEIWRRSRFFRGDEKLFRILGSNIRKISRKIELGDRVLVLSREKKILMFKDENDAPIVRVTSKGLRSYMIEYISAEDELLAVMICISDQLYDDRPKSYG